MDLNILIAECTAYDYKESLEEKKPKSWLKSVSAFANTLGGSLFFGVDNDGNVKGLDDIQHVTETVSMKIRDYMDPLPDVELIPLETEGKHVLQLKVKEGVYTPYYYVGDGQRVAFVRNGDESLPATGEQMVRLVLKGTNRTYDSLRTDKRVEYYSFAILANTFKERVQQDWDKKYLLSFGLVTDDGYLTNAGALFADDCWLSQSRLYCTRWYGLEKSDAINDAEYKGNILLLLREAMNFVKSNTKKGWEKLPDGRKNKPEYAERAVLEAMVNHFIHRDYTVMGGEVHLDIYDDRIAVTSPGGMYSDYCKNYSEKDLSGWRLPDINEWRTLIRNCPGSVTGGSCTVKDSECLSFDSCWSEDECRCVHHEDGRYSRLGDIDSIGTRRPLLSTASMRMCIRSVPSACHVLSSSVAFSFTALPVVSILWRATGFPLL